ncbi:MAG: hypothetical protein H6622_05290 [Halobacteriovoraceae bacterium]|nr:hypothetical protein [Halobacteriovoraceae bacterium]
MNSVFLILLQILPGLVFGATPYVTKKDIIREKIAKDKRKKIIRRKSWTMMTEDEIIEFLNKQERDLKKSELDKFDDAKKLILSGDTKRALYILDRIDEYKSSFSIVKKRYIALIHFINGDYELSYDILDRKEFLRENYFAQICQLQMLNKLILNKKEDFVIYFKKCLTITEKYSSNDQLWFRNLKEIFMKNRDILSATSVNIFNSNFTTLDSIRIWFKFGLYLNKYNILAKLIPSLPAEAYQSNKIREMIALVYYHIKDFDRALSFVEDLDGPNAENIKGAINLIRGKYEMAYGHFQLALKSKRNSLNALERSVPLAWQLDKWNDGLELLKRKTQEHINQRAKLSLIAAFKIRKEDYKAAIEDLNYLLELFRNTPPFEVDMMFAFISILKGEKDKFFKYADKTCKQYDGLSCWLLMENERWENLGKTFKRTDKVWDSKRTVGDLKTEKEVKPILEAQLIDQRDIEELDSDTVNQRIRHSDFNNFIPPNKIDE